MLKESKKGLIIVISAPSGTGKGSIIEELFKNNRNLKYSISATSRKCRDAEEEGVDYFYKTREEFEKMIKNNELIEWVEYCGNYYGTLQEHVETSIKKGINVIMEVEVEGELHIKKYYPECVSIFIIPPTFADLKKRLKKRGADTKAEIEKRLLRAKEELGYFKNYDYIVVNDKISKAVTDIENILKVEKIKVIRNYDIIKELIK